MKYPFDPMDEDTEHGVDMRGQQFNPMPQWLKAFTIIGLSIAFACIVIALLSGCAPFTGGFGNLG